MDSKYDHRDREELVELQKARDRRARFGLVWEANENEARRSMPILGLVRRRWLRYNFRNPRATPRVDGKNDCQPFWAEPRYVGYCGCRCFVNFVPFCASFHSGGAGCGIQQKQTKETKKALAR